MNILRINLHVRKDLNPRLYAALEKLPGKAKAELIRRLAELYLMFDESGSNKTNQLPQFPSPSPTNKDTSTPPNFGDDLEALLNDDQTISFDHDDDDFEEK